MAIKESIVREEVKKQLWKLQGMSEEVGVRVEEDERAIKQAIKNGRQIEDEEYYQNLPFFSLVGIEPSMKQRMGFKDASESMADKAALLYTKNLKIECEDPAIKEILIKQSSNIVKTILKEKTFGGNRVSLGDITCVEAELLGYTADITLGIKSKKGSFSVESNLLSGYDKLENSIGRDSADTIRVLINSKKESIKEKNENGYWKNNPFNKIKRIVLAEGEAGPNQNVQILNFKELEDGLRNLYSIRGDIPDNGYDKTWVTMELENSKGEIYKTTIRIDIGQGAGNYDPFNSTKGIHRYITDDLGYNTSSPREQIDGSKLYIDMESYSPYIKGQIKNTEEGVEIKTILPEDNIEDEIDGMNQESQSWKI